ncbi:uncharacterized protein LOC109593929 isoform X1 [Aethina tumida]|uniref:uncharacterized protein LOC109593929 isoform X1 n=1 Tax=Aethina tumida TaxID=116153 RepID=UPI002147940B|nr:uncharacterized protein LOC109593929 isoform X1 [Aethina tumida]XP_049823243.1 uncharacterized protein LOC109593929 isoform X1 [Aethina tumida]
MVTSTHHYSTLQKNNNIDDQKNLNEQICIEESLLNNQKPRLEKLGSVFSLPGKKRYKKKVLSTLDILISFFVVAPCVVGGWRGVWELMLLYPRLFPPVESFVIGNGIHIVLALVQNHFHDILTGDNKSKIWSIISFILIKVYILIFYISTMLTWYGGWEVYDLLTEVDETKGGIALPHTSHVSNVVFLVVLVIVMLMKVLKNVISVPFEIALDLDTSEILLFPTYFKVKAEEKTSLYILDCLFSILVVGTLVVFVWRGAWVLIDIFLFPDDQIMSAWLSLIIGYATVAVAFLLQPMLRWMCDRATGATRLIVADFFILFSFFGTVNVWRGIWNLLNLYFLPNNLELSCWITHWVCLIILILLGCSNSLLVRGVYIDAEEPAGKCVVFPCYYLRILFQQEKAKKDNSKIQMEDVKVPRDYENNHVINVEKIENVIENNSKL